MLRIKSYSNEVEIASVFDTSALSSVELFRRVIGDYVFVYPCGLKGIDIAKRGHKPIQRLDPVLASYFEDQAFLDRTSSLIEDWDFQVGGDVSHRVGGFNAVTHYSYEGEGFVGYPHRFSGLDFETVLDTLHTIGSEKYFTPSDRYLPCRLGINSSDLLAEVQPYLKLVGSHYYGEETDLKGIHTTNGDCYSWGAYTVLSSSRHICRHWVAVVTPQDFSLCPDGNIDMFGAVLKIYSLLLSDFDPGDTNDHYTGTALQSYVQGFVPSPTCDLTGYTLVYTLYPTVAFALQNTEAAGERLFIPQGLAADAVAPSLLTDMIRQDLPQIAPFLALAAQDAAEKAIGSLDVLFAEHVSEISDLLGIVGVNKLLENFQVLEHVKGKASILFALLDLLTDAALVYSFALAPTIDDAKNIATNAQGRLASMNQLRNGFKKQEYGQQYVVLTREYGEIEVTCRVKLRFDPQYDSILFSTLPAKSVGLLPDLSTVWNLFPMSFVLDYLFPVGRSLEIVDNTRTCTALHVHTTECSIEVASPLYADSYLGRTYREWGSAPEVIDAGVNSYLRFAMHGFPMISPSSALTTYLFTPSTPSFEVGGSLLYKLGRS